MLVSRFAKEQVTVALSADGGDEIFAGYRRYDQLVRINKVQNTFPSFLKRGSGKMILSLPGLSMRYQKMANLLTQKNLLATSDLISTHFLTNNLTQLIQNYSLHDTPLNDINSIPNYGFINTLLAADYKTYMPDDILTKVDRATMSVGLEGREPFLDHRIIEWAAQLPVELKYNKGKKKYLIKKLTHKYLPVEMMDRPKMGFGIPFGSWLRGNLKPLLLETVNAESLSNQNVLNKKYVLDLVDDYLEGKMKDDWQIWLIFIFMLWWKEWMK